MTLLSPPCDRIYYFAYGSNMHEGRLFERVPSARPIGVGLLRGYRLRWHKKSKKDGSGKCDIEASGDPDARVYGVLFEVPLHEKGDLDIVEGLGGGYDEKQVEVEVGEGHLRASTYFATKIRANMKPFTWYKAFVVNGARQHNLPPHYIAFLQEIEADQDPNTDRHRKNMALADRF